MRWLLGALAPFIPFLSPTVREWAMREIVAPMLRAGREWLADKWAERRRHRR